MASPAPATPAKPFHWWLMIVMGAGILVFGALAYLYFHDDAPPEDADLLAPPPIVADDQNGLRALGKIDFEKLDFPSFASSHDIDEVQAQKIQSGKESNDTLTTEFLVKAEPARAQMDTAVTMPFFEFSQRVKNENLPSIKEILAGGKTWALAARLAMKHGDAETALRIVAQLHLLAKRTASAHGTLILTLTAMAVEGIAHREAMSWVNDPNTSPAIIEALSHIFSDEITWQDALQFSFKVEYQFFRNCLISVMDRTMKAAELGEISNAGLPLRYALKINHSLREAAAYYRHCIESAGLKFDEAQTEISALKPEILESKWQMLLPNGVGRVALSGLLASALPVIATDLRVLAEERMTQTAFALRKYYDEHHVLPPNLIVLVPAFINAVPVDPFDGKPLRYDSAKGIIYSVGTSLKDSGGSKFLKIPKDDTRYDDPLSDTEQPTLQLTFQNADGPSPATPLPPQNAAR